MEFLEKIQPYLISDDLHIQSFVLVALTDFPGIPEDWTAMLLKEAMNNKEKETQILDYIGKFPFNDQAVEVLAEGIREAGDNVRPRYLPLLHSLQPELAVRHRDQLRNWFSSRTWALYKTLLNGTEEETWEEYGSYLASLDEAATFNPELYSGAKLLARKLVESGWIEEWEIDEDLAEDMKEEFFSFKGIFAVYMAGQMKLEKHIPLFAELLTGEDDLLMEEASDALISFQNDQAAEAVVPYLSGEEPSVYAISVLSNIKTPRAVELLREGFHKNVDDRELLIEALCQQLSADARPEIEEYMAARPESFLIDAEQTVYSYFKILGMEHKELGKWKRKADEKAESFKQYLLESAQATSNISSETPFIQSQKIGRNDPCPCGSGKKYKKCCGA